MQTQNPQKERRVIEWRGYLLAVLLVALATVLKELAKPDIIPGNIPILYFLAIVPTAIFFGFGPSIFVCVLSAVAYDFFFLPPVLQFTATDISALPILAIFLTVGLLLSYLASNLRKKNLLAAREIAARKASEAELVSYRAHLEELVRQRTTELEKANHELRERILEREKAEAALRESEQRWATTLASIGDAVIATDTLGRITFMNAVAEGLTGWSLADALGKPASAIFNIVNETTRERVASPVDVVLQKGVVCGLANHTILIKKDGLQIAVDDSGAPIKTADGTVTGVVLVFRDITQRRIAEEALQLAKDELQASETRLKRSQEIAHLGSWELDVRQNKLTWSDEAYRIFGLRPQEFEATYEAFLATVHPDDRAMVDAAYSRSVFRGEDCYDIEHRIVRKASGEVRIVHERCEHLKDESGKIVLSVGMVHDITERKKAEEALRESEESLRHYTSELEGANRELESFSYSVSHDLRAPLRALDGFAQALQEDCSEKLDARGLDYLERIRSASQLMAKLIDDMLNLARITRSELQKERLDLSSMVESVLADLQRSQPEREAQFSVAAKQVVEADRSLLQILLRNLLENAWKFTGKRPVARIAFGSALREGQTAYFVSDNGVGFDMQYAGKLFQPFQRLHSSQDYSGTGVGLAIAQRIVQRHGGKIWVESHPQEGTSFFFTLG